MFDKNKIIKIDICDCKDKHLFTSMDFTSIVDKSGKYTRKKNQLLIIKGNDLPELAHNTELKIISNHVNGDRIAYFCNVELSTVYQLNVILSDMPIVLDERRGFYKVKTDLHADLCVVDSTDEIVQYEKPLPIRILNISLGGVLVSTATKLRVSDIITFKIVINDNEVVLNAEILRSQSQNNHIGINDYGCRFINLRHSDEEKLARYIFTQQICEKEQIKKQINLR